MVHGEHNRSKNSGGFALIIFGALMLFLAPQEATVEAGLGHKKGSSFGENQSEIWDFLVKRKKKSQILRKKTP
jgi:hypothetical protein